MDSAVSFHVMSSGVPSGSQHGFNSCRQQLLPNQSRTKRNFFSGTSPHRSNTIQTLSTHCPPTIHTHHPHAVHTHHPPTVRTHRPHTVPPPSTRCPHTLSKHSSNTIPSPSTHCPHTPFKHRPLTVHTHRPPTSSTGCLHIPSKQSPPHHPHTVHMLSTQHTESISECPEHLRRTVLEDDR